MLKVSTRVEVLPSTQTLLEDAECNENTHYGAPRFQRRLSFDDQNLFRSLKQGCIAFTSVHMTQNYYKFDGQFRRNW